MTRTPDRESLSNAQLEALLDHIEDRLDGESCDQTLRHAEAFLDSRGLSVRSVTAWLKRRGCYCDCEILMNLDWRWSDPG